MMKFAPLAGIETLLAIHAMPVRDNAILTERSLHLQTQKKDQASANRKLIFFIFYIICEMIPASVGGEQQACISGGIQSPI